MEQRYFSPKKEVGKLEEASSGRFLHLFLSISTANLNFALLQTIQLSRFKGRMEASIISRSAVNDSPEMVG